MNYLSAAIHFLLLVAELILALGCAVGNLRKGERYPCNI
jgi:hypothetical protein